MTRRATITEAMLRRAIKVAREIDPAAVVAIRGDVIVVLPPGTDPGMVLPSDSGGGNSCDELFGTGG